MGGAAILRDHVTDPIVGSIAETLGDDPDARLRAALLSAVMLGIASSRFLLRMPDLQDVDDADVLRLLSPALHTLVNTETSPAKSTDQRKR